MDDGNPPTMLVYCCTRDDGTLAPLLSADGTPIMARPMNSSSPAATAPPSAPAPARANSTASGALPPRKNPGRRTAESPAKYTSGSASASAQRTSPAPRNRRLSANVIPLRRQDVLRQDALRQDALRQEVLRQDTLRQDVLRQDAARLDRIQQDLLQQDVLSSRANARAAAARVANRNAREAAASCCGHEAPPRRRTEPEAPPRRRSEPEAGIAPSSAASREVTPPNQTKWRRLPPSGIEPDLSKKVYCTYWILKGECGYGQQGCLYKHEMPDRDTLASIGIHHYPRWWQELQKHRQTVSRASRKTQDTRAKARARQGRRVEKNTSSRKSVEPASSTRPIRMAGPDPLATSKHAPKARENVLSRRNSMESNLLLGDYPALPLSRTTVLTIPAPATQLESPTSTEPGTNTVVERAMRRMRLDGPEFTFQDLLDGDLSSDPVGTLYTSPELPEGLDYDDAVSDEPYTAPSQRSQSSGQSPAQTLPQLESPSQHSGSGDAADTIVVDTPVVKSLAASKYSTAPPEPELDKPVGTSARPSTGGKRKPRKRSHAKAASASHHRSAGKRPVGDVARPE